MDIIRRYIPDIRNIRDKHQGCDELIQKFMENYALITYESESQFICKYFMSAILAFCADIDFRNYQTLDSFIRFFVSKQSGIWDIWSVVEFDSNQWKAIERCLNIELTHLKDKTGLQAIEYILRIAHKLNIEFVDPNNQNQRIRFIDFPRFDAIESKSQLWRNIHHPAIDCTLLPENPQILRLLLQYGATIPTSDYLTEHIVHRIQYQNTINTESLIKKLFWIRLATNEISYRSELYIELKTKANQMNYELKNNFNIQSNDSILDDIPTIPSLKQISRYSVRNHLRSLNRLPESIDELEICGVLKDFLNLIYL